MVDFFKQNIEEVLEAINAHILKNISLINTRRVRACNKIKSSDRSKINFIWRSLKLLAEKGILEQDCKNSHTNYKIKSKEEIDIFQFMKKL